MDHKDVELGRSVLTYGTDPESILKHDKEHIPTKVKIAIEEMVDQKTIY